MKKHLRKFMAHYVQVNPFVLSRKEGFSRVIYHELANPVSKISTADSIDHLLELYGDHLIVQVSSYFYYQHRSCNNLTTKAVIAINSYVGSLFRFHYHFYMDTVLNLDPELNQRQATSDFMKKYDISYEDIDRDSMLRDYRRYKKRNKNLLFDKKKL